MAPPEIVTFSLSTGRSDRQEGYAVHAPYKAPHPSPGEGPFGFSWTFSGRPLKSPWYPDRALPMARDRGSGEAFTCAGPLTERSPGPLLLVPPR